MAQGMGTGGRNSLNGDAATTVAAPDTVPPTDDEASASSPTGSRTTAIPVVQVHPPRPRCVLNIGITGHRMDRLTDDLEPAARQRVTEVLSLVTQVVGEIHLKGAAWFNGDKPELRLISALAEGADRLCATVGLELGYRLDCPLPFETAIYAEDFRTADSRAAFEMLIGKADRVLELPGERAAAASAYSLVGGAILGSADILVAIWNGQGSGGRGGTGDVVASALSMGKPVIHIPLDPAEPIKLMWQGEGPSGSGWHSALEPPAMPFDHDELTEALSAILLPPNEAGEHSALNAFLAEREELLLRRIEYPILLAVTGVAKLKPSAWRKDPYLPATRSDWQRFDSYWQGRIPHDRFNLLEHGYAWVDNLANRFAQSFRSGHVVNFAFSALAVALALLGYLIGGDRGQHPGRACGKLAAALAGLSAAGGTAAADAQPAPAGGRAAAGRQRDQPHWEPPLDRLVCRLHLAPAGDAAGPDRPGPTGAADGPADQGRGGARDCLSPPQLAPDATCEPCAAPVRIGVLHHDRAAVRGLPGVEHGSGCGDGEADGDLLHRGDGHPSRFRDRSLRPEGTGRFCRKFSPIGRHGRRAAGAGVGTGHAPVAGAHGGNRQCGGCHHAGGPGRMAVDLPAARAGDPGLRPGQRSQQSIPA
jgi:hypothetical protein